MGRVRTVDLSLNKTSTHVKRSVTRIEAMLVSQMKNSNIAVFADLAKSTTDNRFIDSYFLDRHIHKFILGENIDILDRMMKNAVCSIITEDIELSINNKKEIRVVGVWDKYAIYSIVAAVLTYMKTDYSDEIMFTTLQYEVISKEDLEKQDPSKYMPFSEYNPNKFYQILMNITSETVAIIMNIIMSKIPKAFLHDASDTNNLEFKIVREFGAFMRDDFDEGKLDEVPESVTENVMNNFAHYFEKPFMVYCTEMMKESGLSPNAVSLMLNYTKIFLVYDDNDKNYNQVELMYIFNSDVNGDNEENHPKVEFKITIGDLLDMVYDNNTFTRLSKTRARSLGHLMKKWIINLCTYAECIYVESLKLNTSSSDTLLEDIT